MVLIKTDDIIIISNYVYTNDNNKTRNPFKCCLLSSLRCGNNDANIYNNSMIEIENKKECNISLCRVKNGFIDADSWREKLNYLVYHRASKRYINSSRLTIINTCNNPLMWRNSCSNGINLQQYIIITHSKIT